jgi:miniconductance mechanosensitive channel
METFGFLLDLLVQWGVTIELSEMIVKPIIFALIIVFALITDFIAKRFILSALGRIAKKTTTTWDDVLIETKVFHRLAHIAPAIVLYLLLPSLYGESFQKFLQRVILAYMIAVIAFAIEGFLTAVDKIYRSFSFSKARPIKGYLQVVKILLTIFSLTLIITTILDQSPWGLLSGIGAMSAVILLVFKDSILGLVAGIQLTANDLVRIGDWIEVPSFGADGDVVDISLQNIKVQNWDKTLVTIPIYALISGSFKNWRGMSESGGRRIKRSLHIDMNTIGFLSDEDMDSLKRLDVLKEYLNTKHKELVEYNSTIPSAENQRKLTNIGTFRAYVEYYLRKQKDISQEFTFLVRQLQPGSKGLPIEIYVFSSDINWINYERIQSDIFDHLIAVLPYFGLRVFQEASGNDIAQAMTGLK